MSLAHGDSILAVRIFVDVENGLVNKAGPRTTPRSDDSKHIARFVVNGRTASGEVCPGAEIERVGILGVNHFVVFAIEVARARDHTALRVGGTRALP